MKYYQNNLFFDNLKQKNIIFFISLHFCHKKYRYKIAALVGLYTDWIKLFSRIKEPLAIQMRLTWWRSQFESEDIGIHAVNEINFLKKECDMLVLLDTIENEYLHKDPSYTGKSGYILYKTITQIMGCSDFSDNAAQYGYYYYMMHHQKKIVMPKHKLPFGMRFLRIPIILGKPNQNIFGLLYDLVKNFLI
jgi:hypothetical protein